MPDAASLSEVRDTLFGLIATFLATGTRDIARQFAGIPRDLATQHRIFPFEGANYFISQRPHAGMFVTPGVNVYFGDQTATLKKDQPQRWRLPVIIHVLVPYTDEPLAGEKKAVRLSELVQNAFEGVGGQQQVYDFTFSPPSLVTHRFVSWAKSYRGVWRELGNPSTEVFTNRQWNIETHYTRPLRVLSGGIASDTGG